MFRAIKNARRMFLRNWLLVGIFSAATGFIVYQMINKLFIFLSSGNTTNFFTATRENQNDALIYFILFLFLSFEFLYRMRGVHMAECCSAIPGSKATVCSGQILFLSFLAFLSGLIHFVLDVITYCQGPVCETAVVFHLLKMNVLNVFLVSLCALLIGSVLGIVCSRYAGYAVLIAVVLLSTPMTEPLIVGFGLSNPTVYKIKDFFSFMPVNTFVDNCVTGGSIEAVRWDVLLFWVLFMALLLVFILLRKSSKRMVAGGLAAALVFGCCFHAAQFFTGPDLYNRARRWLRNPAEYYWQHPERIKEKEAAFSIVSYTMDLDLTRQLSAVCTVALDSPEALPVYEFTLSHPYAIHAITDVSGNPLSYTRDGDYITVENPGSLPLKAITFRYAGSNSDFRSDSQIIGLPAYHPYYPFSGFRNLFSPALQTYLTDVVDADEKAFDVSITASVPFITNLKEQNGRYVGTSEGLTIVGGLLEPVQAGEFLTARLILSCFSYDYTDSSWVQELPSELDKLYDRFEIPQENRLSVEGKLILPPLTTFYPCGSLTNGACVYDDHILLLYNDFNKKPLSAALSVFASQLELADDKLEFASLFFSEYLLDSFDQFSSEFSNVEQAVADSISAGMKGYLKMGNQLYQLTQKLGDKAASMLVYNYLCDENDNRTPQQFLEGALAG